MIDCAINRTRVLHLKPGSNQPNGRAIVVVTCDKCPATAERTTAPNMPPQAVANWFGRDGWRVEQDGRAALCPTCTRKSVASREPETPREDAVVIAMHPRTCLYAACGKPISDSLRSDAAYCNAQCRTQAALARKAERKAAQAQESPVPPNATRPNSPESLRGTRQLVRLLDQHFNEERRCYAEGWSDQKVSTETGLALDFVTTFRRETYGELVDPELGQLRRDLGAFEQKANQELRELASLYESTRAQLTSTIDALRARIGKLEAKR